MRDRAALAPGWERPVVEIGIILFNAGRKKDALERLERAKDTLPTATPWLLFNLGRLREDAGDVDGAIVAFEELLQIDDEHGETLDRVAHLYFLVGRGIEARDCCKRARERGFVATYDAWRSGAYRKSGA